ncbi:hypothetical protein, partial [Candidatus Pseudoscillospira sp. SGI.172]|uniref:hypothetical protein n=1 Tax=Candidatus Pseudoscillospira sp. SGI.172 TaxID=3420582 RepID=UPI003CFE7E0D
VLRHEIPILAVHKFAERAISGQRNAAEIKTCRQAFDGQAVFYGTYAVWGKDIIHLKNLTERMFPFAASCRLRSDTRSRMYLRFGRKEPVSPGGNPAWGYRFLAG